MAPILGFHHSAGGRGGVGFDEILYGGELAGAGRRAKESVGILTGTDKLPPIITSEGVVEELRQWIVPAGVFGIEVGVLGPSDVDLWVVLVCGSLWVSRIRTRGLIEARYMSATLIQQCVLDIAPC